MSTIYKDRTVECANETIEGACRSMDIIFQDSTSIIRRSRRSNSAPKHLALPEAPRGTRLVPVHYAGLALEAKEASPFGSYVAVPTELMTVLHGDLEQRYVENDVFLGFGWEVIPGFGQNRRLSRTLAVPYNRRSLVPPQGVHLLESTPEKIGEFSRSSNGWQNIYQRADEQLAWKLSDEEADEEQQLGEYEGFFIITLSRFDLGTGEDGPEYWMVHRSFAGVLAFFRELTQGSAIFVKGIPKRGFIPVHIYGIPETLHGQIHGPGRHIGDQLYAALMDVNFYLSRGRGLLHLHEK